MNVSNMKNMIVLKNLPSNIVEEAIVVLKENKNAKKHQYAVETKNKETKEEAKENKEGYILKEAEMVISDYISNLEKRSVKWNSKTEKLEAKYKKSVKLNFALGFATIMSIAISLI